MTNTVATIDFGTQTTPVKYKVLEDSDTEILSEEETDSGQKIRA